MNSDIKSAMEDLSFIKEVIERTKKDFSRIALFFIWIGLINIGKFALEQVMYGIRNIYGYSSPVYAVSEILYRLLPLIAYGICFFIYYKKIKSYRNDISIGMVKVWGAVLFLSQLFPYLYIQFLHAASDAALNVFFRCGEIITILPVFIALLMTGILTEHKIITIVTLLTSIFYMALFGSMKEMVYGTIGGTGTRISVSSMLIKIIMTFGMLLIGSYLKRGAGENGDQRDTGGVSEQA